MRSKLIVAVAALVLAACQTTQGTHQIYPPASGPQAEPLPPPPAQPEPKPLEAPAVVEPPAPPLASFPKSAEQISGSAVTALMKQARQYRSAGQPDRAAGVLERALRIEPRNYFVWSALGQAYLAQKNYLQAESVAQKSNALARGNVYVAVENWKTIAAARDARGDAIGALQASAQVEALQAQLSAAPGTP
ncbi:tetratricopeptide repeat protein [Solimonas flava]|uniref:tetratricopeptide repeat protein n=1 Tax=Solimonas flava TaxID=415849 RepID=UPI00041CA752|nr:tetratricopeptide repeat protein [Solimonas flava]